MGLRQIELLFSLHFVFLTFHCNRLTVSTFHLDRLTVERSDTRVVSRLNRRSLFACADVLEIMECPSDVGTLAIVTIAARTCSRSFRKVTRRWYIGNEALK